MTGPRAFDENTILPRLRNDLSLHKAGYDVSGQEGIVIEDPLQGRYFRLPAEVIYLLQDWDLGTAGALSAKAQQPLSAVEDLIVFLQTNRLLQSSAAGVKSMIDEGARKHGSLFMRLVHNYLFFKVPLIDPDQLLDWLLPPARLLASRTAIFVYALLGLVGLYFASRQWDKFLSTFVDFFSVEGAFYFGITVVLLKILHELGHGLMAKHYGCRADIIGVAFMVLTPMLYTEINDAWKLSSRRQRLLIAAAGILVELALAAIALFAWAFLPDGYYRSIAFFIAVTAIVTSILMNLSPFMRFDGYHMLGDALGMYNLGPRSFALANWQMRRGVFGLVENEPEILPRNLHRFLVVFAWGTMLYRLVLFLGIAWLVYTMFPKVIGIPAALIEIWFFILLPVVREMNNLRGLGMTKLFAARRAKINLAVFASLVGALFLPLDQYASVPAVLVPEREARIYPHESAQIMEIAVKEGQAVREGDVLFKLQSDFLRKEMRLAKMRLAIVEARLRRIAGDGKDLQVSAIMKRERASLLDEVAGFQARMERLIVRSPIDGWVKDVPTSLAVAGFAGPEDMLAHVVGVEGFRAEGLADERDALRLGANAAGVFVPESGIGQAIDVQLSQVGTPAAQGVQYDYLASLAGGAVAMEKDSNNKLRPLSSVLPVSFSVVAAEFPQVARGTITVEAKSVSVASLIAGRIVAVALRESGF
jgi:putative peptide zinc metalloprotease protein